MMVNKEIQSVVQFVKSKYSIEVHVLMGCTIPENKDKTSVPSTLHFERIPVYQTYVETLRLRFRCREDEEGWTG